MATFLVVLGLVFLVIVGNALILLKTAKKPKVPDSVKSKPPEDNEDGA